MCAIGALVAEQGPSSIESAVIEPVGIEPARWHVETEIASQPDSWRRAARLAGELAALLPDGRIALTGCGTSYYVAQAIAVLWETHGHGQADAFAASEMPLRSDYSRVVVISRSGTTTEVVDLLHRLGDAPTLAIVGVHPGPVSDAARDTLD